MSDCITLAHGSGGRKTNELIAGLFKKHLGNSYFTADDAAVLPRPEGKIAMSTDGFIVSPWKYPGGNIGKNLMMLNLIKLFKRKGKRELIKKLEKLKKDPKKLIRVITIKSTK